MLITNYIIGVLAAMVVTEYGYKFNYLTKRAPFYWSMLSWVTVFGLVFIFLNMKKPNN